MRSHRCAGCLAPFAALVATLAANGWAMAPSSARDCALCHFSWMPAFLDDERDGDLAPMPLGPVVNDEEMCFSCHDGSVVDSRERVFVRHGHKTGVCPPEDMEIPEILPLNNEGQIMCATCHTAHGVDMQIEMATAVFLRVSNANSELCQLCHAPLAVDLESRNHPLGVDLEDEWPTVLAGTEADCGEDHDVICQSCHTPHGSDLNALLVLPIDESTLCAACHRDQVSAADETPLVNHPIGEDLPEGADAEVLEALGGHLTDGCSLTCRTCHSPHAGEDTDSILLTVNTRDELCLLCHTDMESVHLTGHGLAEDDSDLSNVHGRRPTEAGSCSMCHTPHQGRGPMLWAQEPDPEAEGQSALCLSCHGGDRGAEIPTLGEFTHPTGVEPPEGMETSGLPLYGEDLRPADDGLVICSTCHDVHRPRDDWLEPVPEAERAEQSLLADNAGDAMCGACHETEWNAVKEGRHDFTAETNAVPEQITPEGPCSQCHTPHGGQAPWQWAQAPGVEGFMAERLCRSCHGNPEWFARSPAEVHLHPVFAKVGEMPSLGDLPLYDPHTVAPSESEQMSVMTCLTCHDAHRLPMGAGGTVRLPLGQDSPLCLSCHEDQRPLAETDHDLTRHPASAEQALEVDVGQEGTCGVCHRFLDDPETGVRYHTALASSEASDAVADLCITCHRPEGVARERAVALHSHARSVAPTVERRPEHLPLFESSGLRSEEGWITCTTCHDPHVNPIHGLFLRPAQGEDPALCMDCHHDRRWIADTDHDLRLTAPEEHNTLGQTAGETTLCGACHLAHPPEAGPLLWGHRLGEGPDFVTRTCRGCHSEEGCAGEPQLVTRAHPQDAVVLWSPAGVPSYDAEGNLGPAGLITCATCHNPHQWDGDHPAPGPGSESEGDALTSFLRPSVPEQMCAWCHGRDALVRYLLFHREQEWETPALTPWRGER